MRNHKQKLLKKLDIGLLVLFPIVSVISALALRANFLLTTLLFFGLPSVWFSIRTKHRMGKVAIFSFVWAIPLTFFADYIATLNEAWLVPNTVFSFRLLGVVPIEDFIWMFLASYNVLIFYEHFLDKGK